MDSPLDAFPSETSVSGAKLQTTGVESGVSEWVPHFVPFPPPTTPARRRQRRGATRLLDLAKGIVLGPAWAHNERVSVIATAAVTSAGISLLTVWLWDQGPPPRTESLDAVSESREQAQASEPQILLRTPVVNAPILAAAAVSPAPLLSRNTSRSADAPAPRVLPERLVAANPPARAPGPSGLVVITEPEGARVTINGVGWGTTPLTIGNLPSGAKRIRVTRSGYQSEERVLGGNGTRATATLRIVLRETPR